MNELMSMNPAGDFDRGQAAEAGTEVISMNHVVICGSCGAQERPIGPHKTECPNCDDYIY